MIAFANPANYHKFSVIWDEQGTGKFCCAALEDGCISLMDKAGFLPPLLFMTVSKQYDLEYFWKKGIMLQEIQL